MKRIFNIRPENNYEAGQLVLSIRLGEKHIGFSISNNNTHELVQLCWFTNDEINETNVEEVYHAYPELQKVYNKIVIGFDNPIAILVPDKVYKKEHSSALLHAMYSESVCDAVLAEPIARWQIHTVYTIPETIEQRLKQYFPGAYFYHAYTVGINQLKDLDAAGNLFVEFRNEDFSVLVTKGSAVVLSQTFSYSNPADVVYYLLKLCKEFMLDTNSVIVEISGLLEKKSALYVEIYWYFMNVRFRDAGWQLPADNDQDYPSHFFTFFNDLSLCES